MNSIPKLLAAIALASRFALADQSCQPPPSIPPIALPIQDVALPNGLSIRGYPIAVGSPQQILSFQLSMSYNNTYIYDAQGPCQGYNYTDPQCETFRGGLFDEAKSSSWVAKADSVAAGAYGGDDSAVLQSSVWGTDNFQLNSTSVTAFPFGITRMDLPDSQYLPQHVLGFGPNSTILKVLRDAGTIGSTTFSYFWGQTGATSNANMNGTLVLGGYDKAKTIGNGLQLPLKQISGCQTGAVVTLNQITLGFPNGSTHDIVNSPFETCIEPNWPTMFNLRGGDASPFEEFESFTGTTWARRSAGVNFWGTIYPPNAVYDGNFVVTLASTTETLQITIPNSLLVVPEETIDSSGHVDFNSSAPELLVNALLPPNTQDFPRIGRQFFSSAYILVDYDLDQFTIWQANATDDVDLVSITRNQIAQPCSSSPSPSPLKKTLSAGAITGIVIGCLAGVGLLVAARLVFLQSRKRANLVKHEWNMSFGLKPETVQEISQYPAAPQELPSESYARLPVELPGSSFTR